MNHKIIFDSRWINSGGIGRFCLETMKLDKIRNYKSLSGNIDNVLSPIDIFNLSIMTLRKNIFISPGYNGPLLGTNRAIITIHDLMHLNFPQYASFKNKLYYQLIVKRIVKNSPLIFTVSEFTKKEICQWANISPKKIVVLNNGIDHQYFHNDVDPVIRERPYFLYVGNNKSHKNLERLIQSFAKANLNQHCDLLFSCRATESLATLVKDLNIQQSVIFLNGIDEEQLPNYYKGALATVVVSLYEGFCIPVVESMAVGTPVLTSNITAMPETAADAALLTDPYSVDDIAAKMKQLYEQPTLRQQLIEKGLHRAEFFSWEKTRETFNQALEQLNL